MSGSPGRVRRVVGPICPRPAAKRLHKHTQAPAHTRHAVRGPRRQFGGDRDVFAWCGCACDEHTCRLAPDACDMCSDRRADVAACRYAPAVRNATCMATRAPYMVMHDRSLRAWECNWSYASYEGCVHVHVLDEIVCTAPLAVPLGGCVGAKAIRRRHQIQVSTGKWCH